MKKLLALLLIVFSCQFTFAVDDGDFLLQRQITVGDGKNAYGKKVWGSASRSVMENVPIKDSTREEVRQLIKRSIAVDKPTPTKVGSSMLKRIYSPQAIVGTAAVTGLLAAIGWVMEDGIYVKKIPDDPDEPDPDYQYKSSRTGNLYDTAAQLGKADFSKIFSSPWIYHTVWLNGNSVTVQGKNTSTGRLDQYKVGTRVPRIVPVEPPKTKTVPLTAALLGAAMLGSQYTDPDPKFDNDKVNTGDYIGVKDTYEHDPSGVGNELADAMDDKLKNAKPTDDGKSSYIGDPKYDDVPLSDDRDDSSDRGWDEKGDEATGSTEPTKDPETGQATGGQSISLQFPLFCSWASKMCLWYDDWKASDKVYKDHMKKTEEHQTSEKSFWQTVKDWFDWTKEEPEPDESENPEVDDQGIFSRTFDTTFSLSKECPSDIPINFESTYLTGSYTFSMNWLCIIFSFIAYPLVFLSHCIGIWILYETVTQKEIKW